MLNFKKDFNLKFFSLVIAVIFFLTNTAYAINSSGKSHLRLPSSARYDPQRLNDGLTAMLNMKGLDKRQHGLLNRALATFFVGFNKVRGDIHILTDAELAQIDPNGDLAKVKDLKAYRFTRKQLIEALREIGASKREIAYITANLISHPGRFRDAKGTPRATNRATNLFILDEHYRLLSQLDDVLKVQWARHERAHLDDITRSEEEIHDAYPLNAVVEALGDRIRLSKESSSREEFFDYSNVSNPEFLELIKELEGAINSKFASLDDRQRALQIAHGVIEDKLDLDKGQFEMVIERIDSALRGAENIEEFDFFVQLALDGYPYDFIIEEVYREYIEWARLMARDFDEFKEICKNLLNRLKNRDFDFDIFFGNHVAPFVRIKRHIRAMVEPDYVTVSIEDGIIESLQAYRRLVRKIIEDTSVPRELYKYISEEIMRRLEEVEDSEIIAGVGEFLEEDGFNTLFSSAREKQDFEKKKNQALSENSQSIVSDLQYITAPYYTRYEGVRYDLVGDMRGQIYPLRDLVRSAITSGYEIDCRADASGSELGEVEVRMNIQYSSYDTISVKVDVFRFRRRKRGYRDYDESPSFSIERSFKLSEDVLSTHGSMYLANVFIFEGEEVLRDSDRFWRKYYHTYYEDEEDIFIIIARSVDEQKSLMELDLPFGNNVKILLLKGDALKEYNGTLDHKPWTEGEPHDIELSFAGTFKVIRGNKIPANYEVFRDSITGG